MPVAKLGLGKFVAEYIDERHAMCLTLSVSACDEGVRFAVSSPRAKGHKTKSTYEKEQISEYERPVTKHLICKTKHVNSLPVQPLLERVRSGSFWVVATLCQHLAK